MYEAQRENLSNQSFNMEQTNYATQMLKDTKVTVRIRSTFSPFTVFSFFHVFPVSFIISCFFPTLDGGSNEWQKKRIYRIVFRYCYFLPIRKGVVTVSVLTFQLRSSFGRIIVPFSLFFLFIISFYSISLFFLSILSHFLFHFLLSLSLRFWSFFDRLMPWKLVWRKWRENTRK